jgi:DNA-binding GntR family transcriptional regulator
VKSIQTVERQTLTERVYEMLLENICSGEVPPGHKLVIDALSREMKVSITPVREALRRLQREGLVTEVPYSGMHVSNLAIEEIRELFAIRGVLEGYALRLIAENLSDTHLKRIERELGGLEEATRTGNTSAFRERNFRFHATLLQGDIGQNLRDMIDQLVRNTERYRAAGAVLSKDYLDTAQAQHRQLVALLRERRVAEAEMLSRQHATTFADYLAEHLERSQRENHKD